MAAILYTVFWADGSADGLWLATKAGWTGLALVCPKTNWTKARERVEFSRAGVYVLLSPSTAGDDEIYIGEADVLRNRLNNHYVNREWTRLVAFTTSDGSLNKAHVKDLESQLIVRAQQAKRAVVVNGKPSLAPQLSEVEKAFVDNFLADMLPVYRLVGVTAFTPVAEAVMAASASGAGTTLYLNVKQVSARGQAVPDGFVVHEAVATANPSPGMPRAAAERRKHLLDTGLLVPEGDHLRLTAPYVFSSPSAAAAVLVGYSINGLTQWKDQKGVSLKELHQTAVQG